MKAPVNIIDKIGAGGQQHATVLPWLYGILVLLQVMTGTAHAMPPEKRVESERQVSETTPYSAPYEFIDPATQDLTLAFVDLLVPGNGGLDIVVQRSYNHAFYRDFDFVALTSLNPGGPRLTGDRWELDIPSVFSPQGTSGTLTPDTSRSACRNFMHLYQLPGGARELTLLYMSATTETSYSEISKNNWKAECISPAEGSSGRVVYSPDGKRYVFSYHAKFSGHWFVSSVTDKNGNWLRYNYSRSTNGGPDAWPVLNSITASDGRRVQFTYAYLGERPYLTQVTGPNGQVVNYSYETYTPSVGWSSLGNYADVGRLRLTDVRRADGTHWRFTYAPYEPNTPGADSLRTLTTPWGAVTTYSFDINGSLSSKVLSGTVPTASWTFDGGIITGPGFCKRTESIFNTALSESGARSYWDLGLPSKIITYNDQACSSVLQTEAFTWDRRVLINRPNGQGCQTPNLKDCDYADLATYAPLLKSRVITRDGQSYSTTYSAWDSYGNPSTVTESGPNGGSRVTTRTYYLNTSKWILHQPQNESFTGSSTTRTFDANGNLTSLTVDGVAQSFTYDSAGDLTSVTHPRGLVHSYSNYKRGIAQSESQPESITLSRVVDDSGNILSETNGDGWTMTYGYDGLRRVTSVGYPAGAAKSISYGATSATATRGALVETTQFDGWYRPLSISLGGITTTYAYDTLGRRSFESNPASSTGTAFQYDTLGRITRQTHADSSFKTFAYGAATQSITDERGQTTTHAYRSYGNPDEQWVMNVAAADPAVNVSLTRNSKDLVTAATQGGFTRTYGYNGNYYLTSVTNPETGTTSYGRDAAGNLTSRTVGASATASFTYDGQNRLTTASYAAGTPSVTNTYNKRHKLLTSNSAAASRNYNYDGNGNLTQESIQLDGLTFTIGYGYNNIDQLRSMTYPRSGTAITYDPDALGRPTQVAGYVTAVSYWPSGQVRQINYGNGTVSAYEQNSRLWPSSFSTHRAGAYWLSSSYSYDGAGNLTRISDAVDSSYNRVLSYDNTSRLTGINGPWGSGTISYSGIGNITSQTVGGTTLTYSYDSANRLSAVAGSRTQSFTYDTYGNITGDTTRTYAYDDVPNLRCANCTTAANRVDYAYDGTNHRVSVTHGAVKTYEVYDSTGKLLIEFTPSQANKLLEYFYLGGKRIAQRLTDLTPPTAITPARNTVTTNATRGTTLSVNIGGTTPTGTVSFLEGGLVIGSVRVLEGRASIDVLGLALGNHTITAIYSGDATHSSNTVTFQLKVVNLDWLPAVLDLILN